MRSMYTSRHITLFDCFLGTGQAEKWIPDERVFSTKGIDAYPVARAI